MRDSLQSPIIIKYQNLYKEDPNSRVFAPLAEAYRKFGMVDDAIEILKKGIRLHPNFTLGHIGLAYCYFDKKEFQMTYETLKPLVDDNRENLRLQKLYAQTCEALEKNKEALNSYKFLLYINPRDEEVATKVGLLESSFSGEDILEREIIGETFEKQNKFQLDNISQTDESIDDWVQVDLENRNKTEDSENIGEWEMQKLSPNQSSDLASINVGQESEKEQLEENEGNSSSIVTHTLVDMYLEQGSRDRAIEVLEKIIELNPSDNASLSKLNEIKNLSSENIVPQNEDTIVSTKIEKLNGFLAAINLRKEEKRASLVV